MKSSKYVFLLFVFTALVLATGCRTRSPQSITQISTIDAILAGTYDGQITCGELLSYGNFGIGTFDRLDGEMILLDGAVYQVKSDGKVYRPPLTATTPFASVIRFDPERKVPMPAGATFQSLQDMMDKTIGNTNLPYAIKLTGVFRSMKVRSVPAQTKPYPPLVQVTQNQPVFEYENIEGTLIGFRLPAYFKGINVPGYHIHFLSRDAARGGHLLDFALASGTLEIDVCGDFTMKLPENSADFGKTDLSKDRTYDLHKAEK